MVKLDVRNKTFHNTKSAEYLKKNTTQGSYLDNRKNVNINKLLNRVKTNQAQERKKNFILYSLTVLVLSVSLGLLTY